MTPVPFTTGVRLFMSLEDKESKGCVTFAEVEAVAVVTDNPPQSEGTRK